MGLDLIQTKISEIGGRLKIDTRPDKYTQFTIMLPANAIAGAVKPNKLPAESNLTRIEHHSVSPIEDELTA